MFRSVSRTRVALGSLIVVGAITGACSSGTPTLPPNHPPQQYPAATSAPVAQPPNYPAASAASAWPAPRWTPLPPAAWATTAPYPDNNFQDPGVNPFENPNRDPFSTFAMDVDSASYAVGRRYIDDGNLPDRDSVRLEEYVNAFNYGYTPPTNDAFAIYVDGAPTPFLSSRSLLLRVGIQARSVPEQQRPSVALTFVIDTSGSMADGNRLETVKHALSLLVSRMRADDSIAIVAFEDSARVVLQPTSAAEPQPIYDAINSLQPGGSTNAQAGLELGFDLATQMLRSGTSDRVIIASDGVANVGLTDPDSMLGRIDDAVKSGIDLISIGVGMGNFNDALLEQLADRGNGFYAYINDQTEADQVFGSRLTGTLYTVARDARVQVEFNPNAVASYRLLGYENRAMPDQDFNNPTADAGEVGAGHSVTALYEIQPTWSSDPILGDVSLHWIDPDTGARRDASAEITTSEFARDFYSASPSFRLAATVGGFAELLRQSPYASGYSLDDVAREASSLLSPLGGQSDVIEFVHLTQSAAGMDRQPVNDW